MFPLDSITTSFGTPYFWCTSTNIWANHPRGRQVLRGHLKHTTTLFSLSDHDILSREWRVFVHQVQTIIIMVGICNYNQSGATKLLIMRDFHYGRMCFKSVKILGALYS